MVPYKEYYKKLITKYYVSISICTSIIDRNTWNRPFILLTFISRIEKGFEKKIDDWSAVVGQLRKQPKADLTKNPGLVVWCIEGDYTSQLYRDYNKPL